MIVTLAETLARRSNPELTRRFSPQTFQEGLLRMARVGERLVSSSPPLVISVVGSNGKGSTCFFLEYLFRCAGYSTGLFTSPHLLHYAERIRLNGRSLSEQELEALWSSCQGDPECPELSYFELLTLLARQAFANCGVAIYEAGLGGRLDATRTANARIAILTSVELEHRELLGPDLDSIMEEKIQIAGPETRKIFLFPGLDTDKARAKIRRFAPEAEVVALPKTTGNTYLKKNFAFCQAIFENLTGRPARTVQPALPGRLETAQLNFKNRHGTPISGIFDPAHTASAISLALQSTRALKLPKPLAVAGAVLADRNPAEVFENLQSGFYYLEFSRNFAPYAGSLSSTEALALELRNSSFESLLVLGTHRLYAYFHGWKNAPGPLI